MWLLVASALGRDPQPLALAPIAARRTASSPSRPREGRPVVDVDAAALVSGDAVRLPLRSNGFDDTGAERHAPRRASTSSARGLVASFWHPFANERRTVTTRSSQVDMVVVPRSCGGSVRDSGRLHDGRGRRRRGIRTYVGTVRA
jgi:hypothetical protein